MPRRGKKRSTSSKKTPKDNKGVGGDSDNKQEEEKNEIDERLQKAAGQGDLVEVQRLLSSDNGMNVNQTNECGETALHEACLNGHLEVVQYLVHEQKANVEAMDNMGFRPMHVACIGGQLPVVQFLLSLSSSSTVKNKDDLPQLLSHTDNDGWTPLLWACRNGHLETVRYLIEEQKDNVHHKDLHGKTALKICKEYECSEELIRYLSSFSTKTTSDEKGGGRGGSRSKKKRRK